MTVPTVLLFLLLQHSRCPKIGCMSACQGQAGFRWSWLVLSSVADSKAQMTCFSICCKDRVPALYVSEAVASLSVGGTAYQAGIKKISASDCGFSENFGLKMRISIFCD